MKLKRINFKAEIKELTVGCGTFLDKYKQSKKNKEIILSFDTNSKNSIDFKFLKRLAKLLGTNELELRGGGQQIQSEFYYDDDAWIEILCKDVVFGEIEI